MKIYESETSFKDRILNGKTNASLFAQIRLTDSKDESLIKSLENIGKISCEKSVANAIDKLSQNNHLDLMYGDAILVSTIMNGNDDVFLPKDTWAARYTPINTPFNEDHVDYDIIGHIFDSKAVDKDENIIESEEAPEYFDILASFVVYKSIFPKIAEDIATNGPLGKKFVSMEATFNDFDYALVDKSNATKIIARNDETSFLTKYLRVYGGDGYFKDYKVGRVLRNFRFSGMGNVEKPGNPKSEYKTIENFETASNAEIKELAKKRVTYITRGKIMKIETLEDATKVISQLETKIETLEGEKNTNELKDLQDKVATLTNENKVATEALSTANTKIELAEKAVKEANSTLDSTKAELAKKATELEEIHTKAKSESRLAQLKEINFELTDEKRDALLKQSDESFATIIEYAKTAAAKFKPADTTVLDDAAKAKKDAEAALANLAGEAGKNDNATGGGSTDVETTKAKLQKTADKVIANMLKSKKKIDKPNK